MPTVGKTYLLRHCRFGVATVRILAEREGGVKDRDNPDAPLDLWYDIVVLDGILKGIGRGARWGPGTRTAVRAEHCTFE